MAKLTWRFWLMCLAALGGSHLLFGAGWSQDPQPQRSCGCLIELEGSKYCTPTELTDATAGETAK